MKWHSTWVLLILLSCLLIGSVHAQSADLELGKVFAPGTYFIGDIVPWTVTITNNGPEDATNITVMEDASGLSGLDPGTLEITPAAGTSFDAANLTWEIPGLTNGSSATLLINTSFTTTGSKENEVRITAADQDDANSANDEANATVIIQEEVPVTGADLELEKTYAPGTYYVGDIVPWTVTITNNGPEDATNITVMEDASGLSVLDSSTLEITPAAGTSFDVPTRSWEIPGLANGSSATLLINTSFTTAGDKKNTARITAADQDDGNSANNEATATVVIQEKIPVVEADLKLEKTIAPGTYYVGDTVPWTVTITNNGPEVATNITVTEDASGLTDVEIVSITPAGGTTFSGSDWTIPRLEKGSHTTLSIMTKFGSGGEKTNAVCITGSDTSDPDTSNNCAEAAVTILDQVTVNVVIKPETLNLKSRGVFTGFVSFPPCWNIMDIDWSSVRCDCIPAMKMMIGGNNRLIFKFDREELGDVETGDEVTFTITGKIRNNGYYITFTGSDTIRVINPGKTDEVIADISSRVSTATASNSYTKAIREKDGDDDYQNKPGGNQQIQLSEEEQILPKGEENNQQNTVGKASSKTSSDDEDLKGNNGKSKNLKDQKSNHKPEKGEKNKNKDK
jgi:uncharacterized repeat protein (TIGR01451 family)